MIASISGAIPDNNSGAVSAADVRNNMVDTVDSINNIVGSGNHDTEFPFTGSNVSTTDNTITILDHDYNTGDKVVYTASSGITADDIRTTQVKIFCIDKKTTAEANKNPRWGIFSYQYAADHSGGTG